MVLNVEGSDHSQGNHSSGRIGDAALSAYPRGVEATDANL